ncbi:MAG: hypothetical protein KF774_01705 [Planctomyces sp.]|nr:hypothetical protein [Planctomyces sp.]
MEFNARAIGFALASFAASINAAQAQAPQSPAPARPACLIEFCIHDANSAQPRQMLQVFDDGRVAARSPQSDGPAVEARISREEAAQLATELARECRVSGLSTEALEQELAEQSLETGLAADLEGAGVYELKVRCKDGTAQVACPAVGLMAERFPGARRVQKFAKIQQRLDNETAIVQAGGRKAAEELARHASRELLAAYPKATPWEAGDLAMVRVGSDGGRFVQFRRTEAAGDRDQGPQLWMTSIFEAPSGTMRVSVIPPESVIR